MEAEEILNSKITTDTIKLNQHLEIEHKLQKLLEEELAYANKRSISGSRESFFWVNIFEAEIYRGGLKSQFENPVYIVLEAGDKIYQTEVSDNIRTPSWNENFKM